MSKHLHFTVRDCEFETADGLILGGPYLNIAFYTEDGETFEIEGVTNSGFIDLGIEEAPAPQYVIDYLKAWTVRDLAKGDNSVIRETYFSELDDEDERAAADYADFIRDERKMAGYGVHA